MGKVREKTILNLVNIVSAMKRTLKLVFILCCVVTVLTTGPGLIGNAGAETDHFPVYASIQPNVSFWIKIYSVYPSNQGVIHDKRNLDIIKSTASESKRSKKSIKTF
jgi:hypothetical protein